MEDIKRLHSLYQRCVNCGNTSKECPGIWKDIPNGLLPRGFYFQVAPVDLLAVAKNPGHPYPGETEVYSGFKGKELYSLVRSQQDKSLSKYFSEKPFDTFQKNLLRYLSYFLGVDEKDVYKKAAFTNLVKCSTPKEQGQLSEKTKNECYSNYLQKEIDLYDPKVIIAFGRDTEYFLLRKSWKFGIPVIYVRHPSIHYPKDESKNILRSIKNQISQFI